MSRSVLVIGGGISGLKAAESLGRLGIKTVLVERSDKLGGTFEKLGSTFPYGADAKILLDKYVQSLRSLQNVKIHTNTRVKSVTKINDGFEVTLDPDGNSFNVGAVIVATGYTPFDATRVPSYGYGKYWNVITALELVEMIRNDHTIMRPSDKTPAKRITFVTCVGSRDKKTNEYCSSFCCTYTVHLAKMLKEMDKNIEVTIMYIDMRTFSNYEYLFREARALGVKFLRGKPSLVFEKADSQQLTVQLENTITREFLHYKTDVVVLSIGAEPAAGVDDLGKVLGIARDEKTGFFKTSEEDDVSAVGQERVFIAGNASGPKDTQYSLAQASAAAMKALISIGGLQ